MEKNHFAHFIQALQFLFVIDLSLINFDSNLEKCINKNKAKSSQKPLKIHPPPT
ncbi:MAG: hypothetical protein ACJA0S_000644 [Rickettsiales bacterium]